VEGEGWRVEGGGRRRREEEEGGRREGRYRHIVDDTIGEDE
jgi:hypothetical protein